MRIVNVCGAVSALAFASWSVLSWIVTQHAPARIPRPNEAAFFAALGIPNVSLARETLLWISCAPVLAATLSFLAVILWGRTEHPRVYFRWAVAFAIILSLAYPTFVYDFWLSAVWGRMPALGMNPYHEPSPPALVANFPVDGVDSRMTYGPFWAVISTAVMAIAGQSAVAAGILFKLLLVSLWLAALSLVSRILSRDPGQQSLGIVVFGWMPVNVMQTVAEGHNDIAMVAGALAWLYMHQSGKPVTASLLLAAGTLCKYVTAPLFLLDLRRAYLRNAAAVAALTFLVFAAFFRGPDFFEGPRAMRDWHFWDPASAIRAFRKLLGLPSAFVALVWMLRPVFWGLAALYAVRYVRKPSARNLHEAALAIVSAFLFVETGHVWPWFLIWAVAFAALVPGALMSQWAIAVALTIPFPLIVWALSPKADALYVFDIPAICIYAISLAWTGYCWLRPAVQRPAQAGAERVTAGRIA